MVRYRAGRSRWRGRLSSRAARCLLLCAICWPSVALAQEEDTGPLAPVEAEPPQRIDLLTQTRETLRSPEYEDCTEEQEAAIIAGEILVCRRKKDQGDLEYSSAEERRRRYAEETMDAGNPSAPDVFGIPNHGNAIRIGSVPPPALIIDIEALPEAPEGSDADRIGRGLAPRGDDFGEDGAPEVTPVPADDALGLPPAPDFSREE